MTLAWADNRIVNQWVQVTVKANTIAVVTDGTAVLGLGDIGPLAGKPVMEGKGVLFQKFAGIDVFDLEIAERDPELEGLGPEPVVLCLGHT